MPRRLAKGVVWRADRSGTLGGDKAGTGFDSVGTGNDNVFSTGTGTRTGNWETGTRRLTCVLSDKELSSKTARAFIAAGGPEHSHSESIPRDGNKK